MSDHSHTSTAECYIAPMTLSTTPPTHPSLRVRLDAAVAHLRAAQERGTSTAAPCKKLRVVLDAAVAVVAAEARPVTRGPLAGHVVTRTRVAAALGCAQAHVTRAARLCGWSVPWPDARVRTCDRREGETAAAASARRKRERVRREREAAGMPASRLGRPPVKGAVVP